MRCKNCGWENPDNFSKCEKCDAPLSTPVNHEPTESISGRLKRTVSERVAFVSGTPVSAPNSCPRCGYSVSTDMDKCPNCNTELVTKVESPKVLNNMKCPHCGQPIDLNARFCASCGSPIQNAPSPGKKHIQRTGLGTVMSGPATPMSQGKFCTLKPIAWQGEEVSYNPVTYSGEVIVLNRSNTDANNNSITSKQQAVLSFEEGEWFIENRSEMHTTYIRVGEKVKIKSGDIIVLGNREFEFKG